MSARQATVLSNAICGEVLAVLRQVFSREGPDEPDLGLNIAYVTACASLDRLSSADPWEVPGETAQTIRHLLSEVGEMDDPERLNAQLLSLPGWVLRLLDRRRRGERRPGDLVLFRRAGDRLPGAPGESVRVAGRS